MIIVNLKGGLGNQMFQYALGRKLALLNNTELKLEVAGLEKANAVGDIYRPFSLGRFGIVKNIATPEEILRLKYPYGIFSKGWRWFSLRILKNTHVLFEPKILTKTGDCFLDGYWQSPLYFQDIRKELLKDFVLVEPINTYSESIAKEIQNTNSVSIHVRRGDYVKNPSVLKGFGICSQDYYQKAITRIKDEVKNPKFFIFSDDIDWVKNNLLIENEAVFVSDASLTDTTELYLMSLCKHNIIANSSFSWWGAWLNQNLDKVVIAPTPWFDTITYDANLIPDSWILLPK